MTNPKKSAPEVDLLEKIYGLLDERLPVDHPNEQPIELNNDDPDEALAGFTEERRDICGNCGRSPCYARCKRREPNPMRRLVSPWEPEP